MPNDMAVNNGQGEAVNPILAHPGLRALLQQQIAIRDGVAPANTPPAAVMPASSSTGPIAPPISLPAPATEASGMPSASPQSTNDTHLASLLNNKPALENVYHKITSSDFGQNHPVLGKLAGVAAQVPSTLADVAMSLKGLPVLGNSLSSIGQVMPGTTEQHNAEIAKVQGAITQAAENQQKEASAANLQSEVPMHGAQTEYYAAHANAVAPVEITPEQAMAIGHPELAGMNLAGKDYENLLSRYQADQTKINTQKPIQGADGAMYRLDPDNPGIGIPLTTPDGKPITGIPKPVDIKKQLQNGVVDAMNKGNGPEAERLMMQLKAIDPLGWQNAQSRQAMAGASVSRANTAAGQLDLARQSFERDTFGTLFGKDIPSSLVDEAGNTLGWKSPSAPTSSVKQQAQQSQDLVSLSKSVRDEIAKAQANGSLGPYSGRISELMTGKVGADDPQFAKLRTLGAMYLTGAMKAHFGARGGQQMYDHFKALMDTGKMTEGDLLGAMDGFETFFGQYAKRVQSAGAAHTGRNQPAQGGGNNPPADPNPGGAKQGYHRIYVPNVGWGSVPNA